MSEKLDMMITVAWSRVFHACEQELEAKFAGDEALSQRWAEMRERGVAIANRLEGKKERMNKNV